jgi:hypothetical protein
VNAAREAVVDHFVFVSCRDNPKIQYPLGVAKRVMEIWLTPALGFDAANGKVRLYGAGSHPISWISHRDVARAAASAVIESAARNTVVELGGRRRSVSAKWSACSKQPGLARL